jgi:hypothetical protein
MVIKQMGAWRRTGAAFGSWSPATWFTTWWAVSCRYNQPDPVRPLSHIASLLRNAVWVVAQEALRTRPAVTSPSRRSRRLLNLLYMLMERAGASSSSPSPGTETAGSAGSRPTEADSHDEHPNAEQARHPEGCDLRTGVTLPVNDAAELAEILQSASLTGLCVIPAASAHRWEDFVGHPTYNASQLREDLNRFIFLLGGSEGEALFGPPH